MTRRKLTALIVAVALAVAGVGLLLNRKDTGASQTPAATTQDAERPADTSPSQIEQVPQRSQDVFMPPPSSATGMSPPPAPAPK